jgi:hypothetical protein
MKCELCGKFRGVAPCVCEGVRARMGYALHRLAIRWRTDRIRERMRKQMGVNWEARR